MLVDFKSGIRCYWIFISVDYQINRLTTRVYETEFCNNQIFKRHSPYRAYEVDIDFSYEQFSLVTHHCGVTLVLVSKKKKCALYRSTEIMDVSHSIGPS